jgi:hypothetical protein
MLSLQMGVKKWLFSSVQVACTLLKVKGEIANYFFLKIATYTKKSKAIE